MKTIIPGTICVNVISALPGGQGEKVLRSIAENFDGSRQKRSFAPWNDGQTAGTVTNVVTGQTVAVTLRLGVEEGLVLKDSSRTGFSLKDCPSGNGVIILPIGRIPSRQSKDQNGYFRHIASSVVGTWIMHGRGWKDRSGVSRTWPYGPDSTRPDKHHFSPVGRGHFMETEVPYERMLRSTHVGAWIGPNVIESARMGVQVTMHEFKDGNTDGYDIGSCAGFRISDDLGCWPALAKWSSRTVPRYLQEIADVSSSPFVFHATATRKLYPNCRLMSAFLLEKLGEQKIYKAFSELVSHDPDRVYRLIDEKGLTHKVVPKRKGDHVLRFGADICVPVSDVPANLLETFREFATIEKNPTFVLPSRKRLVLDTHVYLVLLALATAVDGVCHHISGRRTYEYVLGGRHSQMHRQRNERVFDIFRPIFGVHEMVLALYRSSPPSAGQKDQYSA